jgi:hypothetical protein
MGLVRRPPLERAGAGDSLALGVVILEQRLGDARAVRGLGPGVLDIVGLAMGARIAAREEQAELAIRAEGVADRARAAIVMALAILRSSQNVFPSVR